MKYATLPNKRLGFTEDMEVRYVCTDAVHHRLAPRRNIAGFAPSFLAEELLEHSQDPEFLFHSQEVCLKCGERITVVVQTQDGERQVSRLHSCNRSELRQQNADLFYLSNHVAHKVGFSEGWAEELAPSVFCSLCPKSFEPTAAGLYRYLKHSNKWMHNVSTYCRACSVPVFFIEYNDSKIICHVCAKQSRPSVVVKPKEQKT